MITPVVVSKSVTYDESDVLNWSIFLVSHGHASQMVRPQKLYFEIPSSITSFWIPVRGNPSPSVIESLIISSAVRMTNILQNEGEAG